MKKTVLVLAVLMLAVPVMAGITITPVDLGSGVVQVNYARTGGDDVNIPRAFALDVRMSPANNTALAPTNFNSSFYVAPKTFTYNPSTGATNWGTPAVEPNTVGFTTEMGSLWATNDSNHPTQPASSGELFRFTVDKNCHIDLLENARRGGVVMESTSVTFPSGYVTLNDVNVVVGPPVCTVPNVVGMDRVAARAAIIAAGFTANEINSPPTVTYQTLRTVSAQNPAAGSATCGTAVDFNAVSYPIKTMTAAASLYVNWVNRGRPACWAYPRQCRGDIDGKKLLTLWVSTNDLAIFRTALGKAETAIPTGGICADLDHKKLLTLWISSNDLAIMRAYLGKAESLIPICGNVPNTVPGSADPNYLYWCVPTGAVCPTGQRCAPVAVCPNSL